MVNTEIRLIIFFATKDGEALYSQQNQDQELTVAQIKNSQLPNFRFKLKKVGKTTAAAIAELHQSCPTLCDPMDGSPQDSPWDSPGKSTGVGCHFSPRENH